MDVYNFIEKKTQKYQKAEKFIFNKEELITLLKDFKSENVRFLNNDNLPEHLLQYKDDLIYLKNVLHTNGYTNYGLYDCFSLWADYSEMHSAGWLGLPYTDNETLEILKTYM